MARPEKFSSKQMIRSVVTKAIKMMEEELENAWDSEDYISIDQIQLDLAELYEAKLMVNWDKTSDELLKVFEKWREFVS